MGKLIRKKRIKRKTQVGFSARQKNATQLECNPRDLLKFEISKEVMEQILSTKVEFGELRHPLPDIWDSELQTGRPMTQQEFDILSSTPRAMKGGIERTFNTGIHSEETEHLSTLKRLREDSDAFIKEVVFQGSFANPIIKPDEPGAFIEWDFRDLYLPTSILPEHTRESIDQSQSKEKPIIIMVGSGGCGESIAQIFRDEIPKTLLVCELNPKDIEKYFLADMIDPIITELPDTINIDKRVIKKNPFKRIMDRKSQRIKSKMLK